MIGRIGNIFTRHWRQRKLYASSRDWWMSIYNRLRLDIKSERLEGEIKEEVAASAKRNNQARQ